MLPSQRRALPILLLALYLALAWTGAHSLVPWCDEGWFSNPAWNLMNRGVLGDSVLDPTATFREVNLTGIDRHAYWIMPLFEVAQVPWYKIAGFGLLPLRYFSALWGVLLLLAWYRILTRLAPDPGVAMAALACLAVDFHVIFAASAGRMDMMAAALGSAGVAAFLSLRERSLPQALFSGIACTACACLTHPNGVFFAIDILFLALYFDRARLFRWRPLLALATPVALSAAGFGLYIARDPSLFAAQFLGNAGGSSGRFLAFHHPLQAFLNEIVHRYFATFGMPPFSTGFSKVKLLVLAAWFASAAAFFLLPYFRAQRGYRAIMGMFLIHSALLALLDGFQQTFYLIYIEPLWVAMAAAVAVRCWSAPPFRRLLLSAACLTVIAVHVSVTVSRYRANPYRNRYLPAVEFVRAAAASGKTVMASSEIALGLRYAYPVTDDYRLGYRSGKHPDLIVLDDGRYKPWIDLLAGQDPANYAYIQQMLARDYQVVYDRPGYRIYQRR